MASNPRLTKNWIQYLKNNQIAALNSDPATGKLTYRRPVTVEDLYTFLDGSSNFGEKVIMDAISAVLAKKSTPRSGGGSTSQGNTQPRITNTGNNTAPAKSAPPPGGPVSPQRPVSKPSSYDDITDVDYKEVPRKPSARALSAPQQQKPQEEKPQERQPKPHFKLKTPGGNGQKPRLIPKGLREDLQDDQGAELSEKDVEEVFSLLLSQQTFEPADQAAADTQKKTQRATKQTAPGQDQESKSDSIRKIKRVIRDTMSPAQRKALWRALNENLSEAQVTNADVKEILKGASELRAQPGIMGKMFKSLRKEQISIGDLQQAWKNAGFPDDTRDIAAILKREFGFGDKEIKKVFAQVFGADDDDGYSEPVGHDAIQNIANYARQHGIDTELINFMKQEFGEELGLTQGQGTFSRMFGKKAVAEEVRQIFTAIVTEERTDRAECIRQQDQAQLGRTKK